MRAVALILLALCASPLASGTPVETPNDAATIRDVQKNIWSWKGKVVAFHAKVVSVHFEAKGQPILKMRVGPGPQLETFWVASLVSMKFEPDDEVVMLGLMTRRPDEIKDSKLVQLVEDPFMVLGMCFINLTQNWGAADQAQRDICDEWFKCRMPNTPQ
jgi:hypothetical protein